MGRLARVHGEHACDQQRIGSGQYGGLHGDTTEQVAQHERCIACHGCSGGGDDFGQGSGRCQQYEADEFAAQSGSIGDIVSVIGKAVAGEPDAEGSGQENDHVDRQRKVKCHLAGLAPVLASAAWFGPDVAHTLAHGVANVIDFASRDTGVQQRQHRVDGGL
jgi:hypothetical protein